MQGTKTLLRIKNLLKDWCETAEFELLESESALKIVCNTSGVKREVIVLYEEAKSAISVICPQLFTIEEEDKALQFVNFINSNILFGKLIYIKEKNIISAILTTQFNQQSLTKHTLFSMMNNLLAIIEFAIPHFLCEEKFNEQVIEDSTGKVDPANLN